MSHPHLHIPIEQISRALLASPETCREALSHGTMRAVLYAPWPEDKQRPHAQDELYVILNGSGRFHRGEETISFKPGDLLFVPAGVEHCFREFDEALLCWAIFWGPKEGERDSGAGPA